MSVKILLSESASRHLEAAGADAFLVVGRESWPNDPRRWVIHLLSCSISQADSAARVARGLSAERKFKSSKS